MGVTNQRQSPNDPALALAAVLAELLALIDAMSDVDYAWRPPAEISGSIGAHVRHCVDHLHVVLDRCSDTVISFDERCRGTTVEHSRAAGVAAIARCIERLRSRQLPPISTPLVLDARLDHTRARVCVESSVGRELVYVLQHTIHHNAVIAWLLAARGRSAPTRFGYASSTPLRIAEQQMAAECAR